MDHFKAILVRVDKTFPMHLWDRLLQKTESTLNMLWQTNIAPKISAYAYMYGQHDFNKMPLAPMGCAVLIHNKQAVKKTWDDHANKRYYTETSREHYQCYKIWNKLTQVLREETDTNIEITEKQKLTQLADIFQIVTTKMREKESEKKETLCKISHTNKGGKHTSQKHHHQQENSPKPCQLSRTFLLHYQINTNNAQISSPKRSRLGRSQHLPSWQHQSQKSHHDANPRVFHGRHSNPPTLSEHL